MQALQQNKVLAMEEKKEIIGRAKSAIARANSLTPEQKSDIARKGGLAKKAKFEANRPLIAIRKGNFKDDFGFDAECYVLNDEMKTAVMSQRGIGDALLLTGGGGTAFQRFTNGKNIREYLGPELLNKIENPIQFQRFTGGPDLAKDSAKNALSFGYQASLLIDVCQAIVKANNDGKLQHNQADLAKQASIILGATAKLGIQTLVYKLAGYDSTKEEVIAAFKAFVQEEAKKYEKEFPPELYLEWARLYGIVPPVRGKSWKNKHLTVDHVYYPLAKSNGKLLTLLRESKNSDGGNKKLFQFLNEVGTRALRMHLGRILEMAESSPDKSTYEEKIVSRFGGQTGFSFETPTS